MIPMTINTNGFRHNMYVAEYYKVFFVIQYSVAARIHIYIESVEYTSGYINFFYYKLKRWGRISLYLDCGRQSTRWKIHEFLSDYANAFFCVNKRSRNKVSKIKFWWVAKHNMPYHCFYILCNTFLQPLHFPMMANKTLFQGGLLSNLKLKC